MKFVLRRISCRQIRQIQAGGCHESAVERSVSSFVDDDTATRDTWYGAQGIRDATSGFRERRGKCARLFIIFFGAILMIFCDPTVGLVVTMPEPRMPWRCGTRHCCRSVLGPLSVARAESKNRDYLTDENSDATDRRQRRNRRFELSFEQEEEESSSSQYDGDAQYEHIIDDRVLM